MKALTLSLLLVFVGLVAAWSKEGWLLTSLPASIMYSPFFFSRLRDL